MPPFESALASIAILTTDVAVAKADIRAHEKLDEERFGRIVSDIAHIKNNQTQNAISMREGLQRVNDRIDEISKIQVAMQVTVDGLPEATASAVRESAASMKNYITGLIISALALLAWELIKTFVLKVA